MRVHYGVLAGLAIGGLAVQAALAQTPSLPQVKQAEVSAESLGAPMVRTATVRQASVTVVDRTPEVGLSAATQQVERYFNDLSTLSADFTQTVTGERVPSTGQFYWRKPGQFLWQYQKPVVQKLVSTGSAVYFVDDRKQVTQLPMNAGMARLFNAKTLNLSKQGLRATNVMMNSRQMAVTFAVDKKIVTGDNTGLVSLKLTFDRLGGGRLQLVQIDAVDSLSVTTRVAFGNLRENVPLAAKMFVFTPGVYDQKN